MRTMCDAIRHVSGYPYEHSKWNLTEEKEIVRDNKERGGEGDVYLFFSLYNTIEETSPRTII